VTRPSSIGPPQAFDKLLRRARREERDREFSRAPTRRVEMAARAFTACPARTRRRGRFCCTGLRPFVVLQTVHSSYAHPGRDTNPIFVVTEDPLFSVSLSSDACGPMVPARERQPWQNPATGSTSLVYQGTIIGAVGAAKRLSCSCLHDVLMLTTNLAGTCRIPPLQR
jgi:hypothetical protein